MNGMKKLLGIMAIVFVGISMIGCDDKRTHKYSTNTKYTNFYEICYKGNTILVYGNSKYRNGTVYLRDNNDKLVPCTEPAKEND